MHDFTELNTNIPAFLAKLWKLVDDPETDDVICWSESGQSFIIHNPVRFTQELLPMYYKHNNMASFIRQLNMYGFHKIVSIESGGLKSERDIMEFSHTCFFKDHPYLMENIKRKMPTAKNSASSLAFVNEVGKDSKNATQAEVLAQVLADVNNLKSKQAGWDAKLAAMKRENEALWRELAIFRQKHHKQEQIINKLIQFIVTMVRPATRNVQLRRRYPLMLNDTSEIRHPKVIPSTSGPTIRELDIAELKRGESEPKPIPMTSTKSAVVNQSQSKASDGSTIEGELSPRNWIDSNTPYVVFSPGEDEVEPTQSPWVHLEDNNDLYNEAVMVPINPAHVNPALAAAAHNPVKQTQNPQHVLKIEIPSSIVKEVNNKRKINEAKNIKKNIATRKKPSSSASAKAQQKNKDLLAEAINMIEDVGLELPNLAATPAPATDPNSEPTIMTLLNEVAEESESANNNELPGSSKTFELGATGSFTDVVPGSSTGSTSNLDSVALARPTSNFSADEVARYTPQIDLGSHVDMVQNDIDILKEFLKGDGYSLDANSLLELFNDDPMSLLMPPPSENKEPRESNSGNEVMAYSSPNLVDLMEMYGSSSCQPSTPPPLSPTPSILETPVMTPASPGFSPAKKRRK